MFKRTLMPFVAGVLVTLALLASFTAIAQPAALDRITPAVIDIRQSVPVEAVINGAAVPVTVDVALQVSLSGPVTVTASAATAPVVQMSQPTDNASDLTDRNGLTYTLEDAVGLENIKVSSKDWLNNFHVVGEFVNPADGRTLNSMNVQITVAAYDENGDVLGIAHGWPDLTETLPGQRTTFTAISLVKMIDVSSYAVTIYMD
jgi:hypothetical protein